MDVVIVDRKNLCFSTQINGKSIELSFDEFSLMQSLLDAVINDYSGKSYMAYVDDKGKIKTVSER